VWSSEENPTLSREEGSEKKEKGKFALTIVTRAQNDQAGSVGQLRRRTLRKGKKGEGELGEEESLPCQSPEGKNILERRKL
jgi:hypothetical protein